MQVHGFTCYLVNGTLHYAVLRSSDLLSWSVTVVSYETYEFETLFSLLRLKVNCKINYSTP